MKITDLTVNQKKFTFGDVRIGQVYNYPSDGANVRYLKISDSFTFCLTSDRLYPDQIPTSLINRVFDSELILK